MFVPTCRAFLFYQKHRSAPTIQALMTATTNSNRNTVIPCRFLSFKSSSRDNVKPIDKKERAKTPEVPKISLFDVDDKIICVTTVAEAEKMANAKKLKLVKMVDENIRTTRPVYKLMSEAEYIAEDLNLRKQNREERKKSNSYIKGEKLMIVSSNITNHDLEMKIHKAEKWLQKKLEIRVLISGNPKNPSAATQEELYKKFEKILEGKSRIVQKIFKSGNLKFHILPLKEEDSTDAEKKTSNDKPDAAESSVV